MTAIDETGKRYGRWTVQHIARGTDSGRAWMCACDCGNASVVRGSSLRSGLSQSCGCLRREQQHAKRKPVKTFTCAECKHERDDKTRVGDVCARCWEASMPSSGVQVGMRFGRLLVTKLRPMVALCDCGNIVTNRRAHHLAFGRLRSCGCLRKEKVRVLTPNERWSSVECIDATEKIQYRKFRVTCARCDAQHVRTYSAFAEGSQGRGCISCARYSDEQLTARRVAVTKRLEREARKAAAE